jgi:hypothetical protein
MSDPFGNFWVAQMLVSSTFLFIIESSVISEIIGCSISYQSTYSTNNTGTSHQNELGLGTFRHSPSIQQGDLMSFIADTSYNVQAALLCWSWCTWYAATSRMSGDIFVSNFPSSFVLWRRINQTLAPFQYRMRPYFPSRTWAWFCIWSGCMWNVWWRHFFRHNFRWSCRCA